MSAIARVRFANLSAEAVDIAVTPSMTVGDLKAKVWSHWPEPKPPKFTEDGERADDTIGHGIDAEPI